MIRFSGSAVARPTFQAAPTFSQPHPAVVRVVVPEKDGAAYGSGTLVDANEVFGIVATNWHVVRGAAGTIGVIFPDGFRSAATVLRVDRDWDLAALLIWRPKAAPIVVSNRVPRPGDVLTIAGYGSGAYRAVSGRCTQYLSPVGNFPSEMIELAAPAREGDSGGPILNDRGELVGVLFGSAFGKTSGSHCGRLREFIAAVDGDYRRLTDRQMLARRTTAEPPPLASISGAREAVADPPRPQPAREQVEPISAERTAAAPAPPSPAVAEPRCDAPPAPDAAKDSIKTVLAAIGLIAVAYAGLRLLGRAIG
ncbi:MAG: trypsin-like peptidase domain-containing protein [Pirellulales bacterium]|nr:trypsin-like peptidase domain-containing protein [Pirellulales bacterium]